MGFPIQAIIGNSHLADGSNVNLAPRYTNEGAAVIQQGHGKYFEQAIRGNVSYGGTAAAGAVLAATTSGNIGALYWNKASGAVQVMDEIARVEYTMPLGAQVLGSFNWYYLNAGSNIGTAAPIATLVTVGTIVNALLGAAPVKTPAYVCYVGASTWTAAGGAVGFVFLRVAPISLWAGAVNTTTAPAYILWEDYDGTFIIPPGMAVQLNGTGTTNVGVTATVVEVPVLGALG
jgi:hypothetical protein